MVDYPAYFNDAKAQLHELLEGQKKADKKAERSLQLLLEKYPFLLTGCLTEVSGSHNIFSNIIISQPAFKSHTGDRSPDFLIITWNSLNFYFNFVELEDPSKKIFLQTQQKFTSEFDHAYNQLMQWRSMKTEVADYCHHLLTTLLDKNFNNTADKMRHYNYVLVYGFSGEVQKLGTRHNSLLQEYFTDAHLFHTTYSRLTDHIRFHYPLFTVRFDPSVNQFRAIGFTPFLHYATDQWSDFRHVTGKQQLINICDLMTAEEKTNLISQIDEMDAKTQKEVYDIVRSNMGRSFRDLKLP